MEPLVKWNGGLERKVALIKSMMPGEFDRYYEPFLGGGAVYFQMEGRNCLVTAKCKELMTLYRFARRESPAFANQFKMMCTAWKKMEAHYMGVADDLADITWRNRMGGYREYMSFVKAVSEVVDRITYSDTFGHVIPDPEDFKMEKRYQMIQEILRMEKLVDLDESDVVINIQLALKHSIYSFLTEVLNKKRVDIEIRMAALAFILNYSADVPFRKDECGEYRLPFGGKPVCEKYLTEQVKMFGSERQRKHFEKTVFSSTNALDFLKKNNPCADDFILLDPPDEVKKGAGALDFTPTAHKELAKYLLTKCDAQWMLLVKPNVSTMRIFKKAPVSIVKIEGYDKYIIRNY